MVRTLEKKTDLKKKKKKVEWRRWDEGVLYRFADAWVVWEEEWKELKKEKEKKKRDDIYDTWEG